MSEHRDEDRIVIGADELAGAAPPPPPPPSPPPGPPVAAPVGPLPGDIAQRAPLAGRYTADLIDGLIIGLIALPLSILILVMVFTLVLSPFAIALAFLSGPAVVTAYAIPLMARRSRRNGQTLGRQLLSVRVANVDGSPVSAGDAFVREVVWKGFVFGTLSSLLLGLPWLLDVLSPLWHPQRRAWHDLLAGTIVVDTRPPVRVAASPAAPTPAAIPPAGPPPSPPPSPAGTPLPPPSGEPIALDPPQE